MCTLNYFIMNKIIQLEFQELVSYDHSDTIHCHEHKNHHISRSKHLNDPSLVPSPSYTKREKGSGERDHTTVSLWNRNTIIGVLVCVK